MIAPNPGAGYRLLEPHEIVRSDQIFWPSTDTWHPVRFDRGTVAWDGTFDQTYYRRPIHLDSKDNDYRILDENETICVGDEVLLEEEKVKLWKLTICAGRRVGAPETRPVLTESKAYSYRRMRDDISPYSLAAAYRYSDTPSWKSQPQVKLGVEPLEPLEVVAVLCAFCNKPQMPGTPVTQYNSKLRFHGPCLVKSTRIQRVLVGWETDPYAWVHCQDGDRRDEYTDKALALLKAETETILKRNRLREVGIDDMSGDDL